MGNQLFVVGGNQDGHPSSSLLRLDMVKNNKWIYENKCQVILEYSPYVLPAMVLSMFGEVFMKIVILALCSHLV